MYLTYFQNSLQQGTIVRPTNLYSQVFCVLVSVVLTHNKTASSSKTFPGMHFCTARRGHDLVHPLTATYQSMMLIKRMLL